MAAAWRISCHRRIRSPRGESVGAISDWGGASVRDRHRSGIIGAVDYRNATFELRRRPLRRAIERSPAEFVTQRLRKPGQSVAKVWSLGHGTFTSTPAEGPYASTFDPQNKDGQLFSYERVLLH
jgi:hypothetical protein